MDTIFCKLLYRFCTFHLFQAFLRHFYSPTIRIFEYHPWLLKVCVCQPSASYYHRLSIDHVIMAYNLTNCGLAKTIKRVQISEPWRPYTREFLVCIDLFNYNIHACASSISSYCRMYSTFGEDSQIYSSRTESDFFIDVKFIINESED